MSKRRMPVLSTSGQERRKRQYPYFVTKTTIEEIIDFDSSEDGEEVVIREANLFDLIELEKR